jgi:hypothetical protein
VQGISTESVGVSRPRHTEFYQFPRAPVRSIKSGPDLGGTSPMLLGPPADMVLSEGHLCDTGCRQSASFLSDQRVHVTPWRRRRVYVSSHMQCAADGPRCLVSSVFFVFL